MAFSVSALKENDGSGSWIYRSSLSTKPDGIVRWTGFASGWKAALMSSPWSQSAAYRLAEGRTFFGLVV